MRSATAQAALRAFGFNRNLTDLGLEFHETITKPSMYSSLKN